MKDEIKLCWQSLIIIWLWHDARDVVDDETAFVALCRTKAFVDKALGILAPERGEQR